MSESPDLCRLENLRVAPHVTLRKTLLYIASQSEGHERPLQVVRIVTRPSPAFRGKPVSGDREEGGRRSRRPERRARPGAGGGAWRGCEHASLRTRLTHSGRPRWAPWVLGPSRSSELCKVANSQTHSPRGPMGISQTGRPSASHRRHGDLPPGPAASTRRAT